MGQRLVWAMYGLGAVLLGGLAGCSRGGGKGETVLRPEPLPINSAIRIVKNKEGYPRLIAIHQKALDQEFLLQGSTAFQVEIPWSTAFPSRIVRFQERDGQVILSESSEGNVVDRSLSQKLLIAVFQRLESPEVDKSWVVFDFNEGMKQVPTGDDWTGTTDGGTSYKPVVSNIPLKTSYIEKQKLEKERLEIYQIGVTNEHSGSSALRNAPVGLKYYLSTYKPDPNFKPMKWEYSQEVGFFETSGFLEHGTGRAVAHAAKFNTDKPIRFAISSNTPAEFYQAVADGVLYWNRTDSGIKVEVVRAPEGVHAPDIDYNVIQWVEWSRARYAYADAQVDPRTGQVLHAQVYLPSNFAFSTLEKMKIAVAGSNAPVSSSGCQLHAHEALKGVATKLIAENASPEVVLRAAQDMVRSVTAHEVGHVLGLRHNFAGSLGAKKYTHQNEGAIFENYLGGKGVEESLAVTASVMDYLRSQEDILAGAQIAKMAVQGGKAFEYDTQALQYLYQGKRPEKFVPFCTDDYKDRFLDCAQFDAGGSIVEVAGFSANEAQKNLHVDVFKAFLAAKAILTRDLAKPVERVSLEPSTYAQGLAGMTSWLLKPFGEGVGVMSIRKDAIVVDESNKNEVQDKEFEYFTQEIQKSLNRHGKSGAFASMNLEDFQSSQRRFEALLKGTWGIQQNGGKDSLFTPKEQETILRKATVFYSRLPELFARADISAWSGMPESWKEEKRSELNKILLVDLEKRLENYLFTLQKQGDSIRAEVHLETQVLQLNLPRYAYSTEVRTEAAKLLTAGKGAGQHWGKAEKKRVKEKMLAQMKTLLDNADLSQLKVENIQEVFPAANREKVVEWITSNRKVLDSL